jgi:hypothetical protein
MSDRSRETKTASQPGSTSEQGLEPVGLATSGINDPKARGWRNGRPPVASRLEPRSRRTAPDFIHREESRPPGGHESKDSSE